MLAVCCWNKERTLMSFGCSFFQQCHSYISQSLKKKNKNKNKRQNQKKLSVAQLEQRIFWYLTVWRKWTNENKECLIANVFCQKISTNLFKCPLLWSLFLLNLHWDFNFLWHAELLSCKFVKFGDVCMTISVWTWCSTANQWSLWVQFSLAGKNLR